VHQGDQSNYLAFLLADILSFMNSFILSFTITAGKSTLLKAIGARAVPIPASIDLFFLSEEVEPSDTLTALDAVMEVDEERLRLEKHAEDLNHLLADLSDKIANGEVEPDPDTDKTAEEQQEEVMDALSAVYERLDALDAATAEVRARSILKGLGFTHEMQGKLTKDFSGGWRMRVSLARALFIQPMCLLLDEPTNHVRMLQYRLFLVESPSGVRFFHACIRRSLTFSSTHLFSASFLSWTWKR